MPRITVDELERDIKRPEPFEYESRSGELFTFKPPKGLHYSVWTSLQDKSGVPAYIEAILGDQYADFIKLPEMDGYLMEKLMDAYNKHFAVGDPGESPASSAS